MLQRDCDDGLRLTGSLTRAVQFHGEGISQELSRASERDFIKVPLRKRRPRGHAFAEVAPGACFALMIAAVFKLIVGLYREENQRRLTKGPAYSLLPARW